MTYSEIAREIGLTRERVRQIVEGALAKLRLRWPKELVPDDAAATKKYLAIKKSGPKSKKPRPL